MSIDDLYQEIILEHSRHPRNKGPGDGCHLSVQHNNPLCGDDVTLCLHLKADPAEPPSIERIGFEGQGCSISQASTSMMTEAVAGLSFCQALDLVEIMRRMMQGQPPSTEIGDLIALEGVARFPVRVKCALLPWMALKDVLDRHLASLEGRR